MTTNQLIGIKDIDTKDNTPAAIKYDFLENCGRRYKCRSGS